MPAKIATKRAPRSAPTKAVKQITAWSYSRLHDYESCPLKAKLKHVDRIQEPQNDAMLRGTEIHTDAENWIKGVVKKRPASLDLFAAPFEDLRKIRKRVQVEIEWAFDSSWHRVDWFSRQAWVRVKLDVAYVDGGTLVVIDHKTGKVRGEHKEQLELYAVAGALLYPEVERVDAELWYLDQGEIVEASFSEEDCAQLQKKWTKRPQKMLSDKTFKPTPNALCGWCYFSKSNENGPKLCPVR